MSDWDVRAGAIVERPRDVADHPFLERIYERHDEIISDHLSDGRVLEVAFGQHVHPATDVGVEAWGPNAEAVDEPAVLGDARSLPFADGAFDSVIGRRFLHHVPPGDRPTLVAELARVLAPGGRLVLIEGTPGAYREVTKRTAFRLGLLEEDNDEYGHLSTSELFGLVALEFDVVTSDTLGSPLMLASISQSPLSTVLFPAYCRTQFVNWWTLIVGRRPE